MSEYCPQGHRLEVFITGHDWQCSQCHGEWLGGAMFGGCLQCRWDTCPACRAAPAGGSRPPAEVRAPDASGPGLAWPPPAAERRAADDAAPAPHARLGGRGPPPAAKRLGEFVGGRVHQGARTRSAPSTTTRGALRQRGGAGNFEQVAKFEGLAAKERERLAAADDEAEPQPPWRAGAAAFSSSVRPPAPPLHRAAATDAATDAAADLAAAADHADATDHADDADDADDYPAEYYEPAGPADPGDAPESVQERPKKRRRGKPRCRPGSTERRLLRVEKALKEKSADA